MTSQSISTQTSTALRTALERLAQKWTITLPSGHANRYHFFGDDLGALLAKTADSDLASAAAALADNWGNAGVGVPDGHARIRGYFAFDVNQAIKANPTT